MFFVKTCFDTENYNLINLISDRILNFLKINIFYKTINYKINVSL